MPGNKHACSACIVCEVMHLMSTSSTSIEYYIRQYFVYSFPTCCSNHIPRTFRCQAGWIFYCPYLMQCIICIELELRHKWWGGFYAADHNTYYFNARNFSTQNAGGVEYGLDWDGSRHSIRWVLTRICIWLLLQKNNLISQKQTTLVHFAQTRNLWQSREPRTLICGIGYATK